MTKVRVEDELPSRVDCGMEDGRGLEVDSVQVHSSRVSSVVTLGNPVRIQDGNDLEAKESTENEGSGVRWLKNEFQESIEHELGAGF